MLRVTRRPALPRPLNAARLAETVAGFRMRGIGGRSVTGLSILIPVPDPVPAVEPDPQIKAPIGVEEVNSEEVDLARLRPRPLV